MADMKREETLHEKLLRRRVEINRADRERYEKMKNWLKGRMSDITSARESTRTSFFCETCDADFDGMGYKQVRWPKGTLWFAYYLGFCPKRHPCVRRITDRLSDPYFYKSYVVRKQQAKHGDEFLPHWHPRFKVVYPEAYAKLVARGEMNL